MEIQKHYIDAGGNYFVAPFTSQERADLYEPPDGSQEVPERPSVDHVWQGGEWVYVPPPAPPPPALAPYLAGIANLAIHPGEVGGIETAAFLSAAIWMGSGFYWVFFAEPMPDMNFIATASASAGRANVTARALEYVEITVTGDDGSPSDPAEVALQIYKVR